MRAQYLLNGRLLVTVAVHLVQSSELTRSLRTTEASCGQVIILSRWVKISKHHKLFAKEERKLIAAAEGVANGLVAISRAGSISELCTDDDKRNDLQVRIETLCYANCSAHQLWLYLREDKELPAEAICLMHRVATGNE